MWSPRYRWACYENSIHYLSNYPFHALRGTITETNHLLLKMTFFPRFELILFNLQGTPASAKNIPILVLFVPLFLLQGAGVFFATYRLVEKSVLLIHSGSGSYGRYFTATASAREFLGFFQHGARYELQQSEQCESLVTMTF